MEGSSDYSDDRKYTVYVSSIFSSRIKNHVQKIRRAIDPTISDEEWVKEAISEKLKIEQKLKSVEKEKTLSIILDPELSDRLKNHLEVIKEKRNLTSKKQWILDAIDEKMDRESDVTVKRQRHLVLEESSSH